MKIHFGHSIWAFALLALLPTSSAAQTFVYTNNGDAYNNTVYAFVAGPDGSLTEISGSPFPTGGGGDGINSPFANIRIVVAGNFLYVTNEGTNSISGFSINSNTGLLTAVPGSPYALVNSNDYDQKGYVGISLAATPDGTFLYVRNSVRGTEDMTVFSIAPDGSLTSVGSPIVVGAYNEYGHGMKVSPDGKFLFVGATGVFGIASDGTLTFLGGSVPDNFDINCEGNLLFDCTGNMYNIAPDGSLSGIPGCCPGLPGMALSFQSFLGPDDRTLFISNTYANGGYTSWEGAVSVFQLTSNNILAPVPGSPFLAGGNPQFAYLAGQLGTSPDGTFLYVPIRSGSVSVFRVAADGTLSLVPGAPFPVTNHLLFALEGLAVYPPKICGNTPVGTNIVVQPKDSSGGTSLATLTFANVSQRGNTTLTTSSTGPPAPIGFELGNPPTYFNLASTAVVSGEITVCIDYSGLGFTDPSSLRLFHYDQSGSPVDVTTSNDTVNSVICGTVTSLSPFAVAQPAYVASVQPPISADGSSVFAASRGVVPVKFTVTLGGVPTCQLPQATVSVFLVNGSTQTSINQGEYIMPADNGSNFRVADCQYIYNLNGKSIGTGTYQVNITIGNSSAGSAVFAMK